MGTGGPDDPVGVTRVWLLERGIAFRFWGEARDFLFARASRLAVGPTKPLTVGTGAVQLPPSIANVTNEWKYTSAAPTGLHGMIGTVLLALIYSLCYIRVGMAMPLN